MVVALKVGKSVTKAINEWILGDLESAMLHACNAVDGTARKHGFASKGNRYRFVQLLRDNFDILGPMGMPGVDVFTTEFPVVVEEGQPLKFLDLAELIYVVHRCSHGHGDELPGGFELLDDARGPAQQTHLFLEPGKVRLSDRIIFGLLAVVVGDAHNVDEDAQDGHFLTYNGGPNLSSTSGGGSAISSLR
jgi:hypothetical protein